MEGQDLDAAHAAWVDFIKLVDGMMYGLKLVPFKSICCSCGTTEVVPFYKAAASCFHASRSFLPVRRIAASVEAGDDRERFVSLDDEHQRVWKAAKQGAAHVLVDYWELAGSGAYALNHGFNRRAVTPTQSGSLVLIPVLRVDQLGAGARGKDNRMHYGQRSSSSVFKAAQVMPSRRSSSSVARQRSSSLR